MKYNGSDLQEVPECLYFCPRSPLPNKTENLDVIWDGSHWSDTVPIFSCTNSKLVENTRCYPGTGATISLILQGTRRLGDISFFKKRSVYFNGFILK